ncbi:MAG TPA: DUF4350 domain-containing protein [Longimicrobium sp.]
MGSRRDVAFLALLIVLVLLIAVLTGRRVEATADDPRPSTFVAGPAGARALRDVLTELKVPTRRRMQPFLDADSLAGPLVLLSPMLTPSSGELHALAEWVRRGGTVIYAARLDDETADSLGLRVTSLARDTLRTTTRRYHGATATAEANRLTEGVGTVDGFRTGFLRSSRAFDGTATVLASARRTPVVVDYRLGKGRVIAWSDALPLVNGRLKRSRAAILFARTAVDAGDRRALWFDEYHHGFKTGGSVIGGTTRFLLREPAGHAALQVAAALLGLVLLFGRRFGKPLPPPPARRRSPLEHVEALAGAYLQAGARDTARRLLLAGMARRLGRRVPHTAAAEGEMLQRLAAHPTAGQAARELEAEWKKGRSADLVALARDVDRYIDEVSRT